MVCTTYSISGWHTTVKLTDELNPTLLAEDGLFRLALDFALPLVRDLVGHGAGHVQLVDVQAGLAEGRHGGVHACIAVGGAAQRSQVQGFAPRDDGDVERELAPAVR